MRRRFPCSGKEDTEDSDVAWMQRQGGCAAGTRICWLCFTTAAGHAHGDGKHCADDHEAGNGDVEWSHHLLEEGPREDERPDDGERSKGAGG